MIKVLTGKNSLALKEYKNNLITEFIHEYGEYAVEILNASEKSIQELQGSIQSMPFLVTNKLVIWTDIINNKELTEKLPELLSSVISQIDLIIFEPNFDKRSVLYKNLKKDTKLIEFNVLDEYQTVQWLINLANEKSIILANNEAQYLVGKLGTNQQKLFNELEKLANFDKKISKSSIDLLTVETLKSTSFDMLDAIFKGDSETAIRFYKEQRLMGVEPQLILGAIIWQIRVLLVLKYSKHDINETARASKLSPYSLKKSSGIASKLTKHQLKELVSRLIKLDNQSKSMTIDIDDAMMNQLILMANLI